MAKAFRPAQAGTVLPTFDLARSITLDSTEVTVPYSFTFPAGPGTDGYALTWGPTGLEWTAIGSAADSTVPYRIPVGQSFTVNENRQALWAMTIDVEGTLEVDGLLVQVS